MMKGTRPPILSRMDFHYDFILKTLQAGNVNWKDIMERSYWFKLRKNEIIGVNKELNDLVKKINEISLDEVFYKGCVQREEMELANKSAVNSSKKETQKQLNSLLNKQVGPKWVSAWKNYKERKQLEIEFNELNEYLNNLKRHEESISPSVKFLNEIGYIKNTDINTLKNSDLTLKGILATEINEGHQILITELYVRELAHNLSGEELVPLLSCFLEEKDNEESPTISDLSVSLTVKNIIKEIQKMTEEFQIIEDKVGYPIKDYWRTSLQMIDPINEWIQGEHASVICSKYGLFEGNFIRSVMKMANILDEWLSLATYCQHTEQIEKIIKVRENLVKNIAVSDSLYLHL
jgi:superfamily II RNA helicase